MEALPSGFERTAVEVDLDLLAYDLLHSLVVDLFAQQRLSVILDTPALRAGIVQRATELVHSSGGTLKVILCRTDLETRNERLLQRAAKSSHRTMHTIETDVDKHFGHLPPRTLIIQTDRPLSDLVAEAMLYLQA
jgi:hypothetical protein